jgi:hypothetical protein
MKESIHLQKKFKNLPKNWNKKKRIKHIDFIKMKLMRGKTNINNQMHYC